MTPTQQVEAIRLAARLQAEDEARDSGSAMMRAAEEAGIERRFLVEAAARVACTPAARRSHNPSAGVALAAVVAMLVALWPFVPALPGVALIGFLFALYPTLSGRPRAAVAALVVASWLLFDLALWAAGMDVRGEFTLVGLLELAGAVLGIVLAELAAATRAPQEGNRPQSL